MEISHFNDFNLRRLRQIIDGSIIHLRQHIDVVGLPSQLNLNMAWLCLLPSPPSSDPAQRRRRESGPPPPSPITPPGISPHQQSPIHPPKMSPLTTVLPPYPNQVAAGYTILRQFSTQSAANVEKTHNSNTWSLRERWTRNKREQYRERSEGGK